MSGFFVGHMAVEFYQGEWILRATQPNDRPITDSEEARIAMNLWLERNRAKFLKRKETR